MADFREGLNGKMCELLHTSSHRGSVRVAYRTYRVQFESHTVHIGPTKGTAMTMTNASSSARRVKFTPQAIEEIKQFVAEGISRDEIANRLDVTVGSLQVTCSRLGISLRRIILSNGSHHTADSRGIPTPCSVGMVRVQEQKDVSQPVARATPFANFAIIMRHKGEENVTDLPLPSPAIEALALQAMSRHLDIGGLIGQVLVAAINKDIIQKILR